jgi:hypothetical protein
MAKDTLTFKLSLNADFETIQTIRRLCQGEPEKSRLTLGWQAFAESFLNERGIGGFALSSQLIVSRVSETKQSTNPPPVLKKGVVTIWDYELDRKIQDIRVDGPDWLDFLAGSVETSFRYEHPTGFFTAIKEHRRGRPVWYAHRRLKGQLKRFYLGVPQTLSAAKLADVAQKMSLWALKNLTAP